MQGMDPGKVLNMSRLSVMQSAYESGRHNPFPSKAPGGKRALSTNKSHPPETKVRQRPASQEADDRLSAAHK